jgi:hypothetical protein
MPFVFNPLTGNLDVVRKNRTDEEIKALVLDLIGRIITTNKNVLGNTNFFYDATACKWVEAPPQLVTDEDGKIQVANPEDC